jgi:hypothetical protein
MRKQEFYCYLDCIRQSWADILGSDVESRCLDIETVRLFHLLWGAKVLHFLGVDVEVVATALEIAVWAEFDDFLHK